MLIGKDHKLYSFFKHEKSPSQLRLGSFLYAHKKIWKLDCQILRAYHVREFVEMCHFVNIFEGFRFNKYFKFKKNKIIITAQEDSGNPVTKERSWLMTN